MLAGSLRWSSTAVTDDGLMAVGWRWGVGGWVMSGWVGLCRVRVGLSRSGSWGFLFFGVGVVGFGRIRGRTGDEQELCGR